MKPSIKELKGKHGNKPVAILGGGPSLPEDLKKLPKDCILIGVNHHYATLVKADYCVFLDRFKKDMHPALSLLKETLANMDDTIKITKYNEHTDYILDVMFWEGGFSSSTALWLGSYLSSGKLLLCGMDCYQGKNYFRNYDMEFTHPIYNSPLLGHLNAWNPALKNIKSPDRIKAVSGPLEMIFGKYIND